MIILLNPQSARHSFRVPNSILTIGAFLEEKYNYHIVDENLDRNIEQTIGKLIEEKGCKYLGITVMPALQLQHSVAISKNLKSKFPNLKIIWGGYFPSLHPNTVLKSDYVDYVTKGHSEFSFVELIDSLEGKNGAKKLSEIAGLSYRDNGEIKNNPKAEVINPDLIPRLSYEKADMERYLKYGTTFLGPRTMAYHSSVGCPFLCGFCAVAGVYKGRWIGRNAQLVSDDLHYLKKNYNIGAVEFHDNNFFVSEKRCYDIADKIMNLKIGWWGEARPDTMMKFTDDTWEIMSRAGCKMIFYGAESSSEDILKLMDKGGTQTPATVLELAERAKKFNIVPEFSFVLGSPTNNVDRDIDNDIKYIREVKKINPDSEIIIYTYSPVNFEDSEMSLAAKMKGFYYPQTLEEWTSPHWANFDLRKNPLTPWLKPHHFKKIRNFEKTLNAYYPTKSDLKIKGWRKSLLKISSWVRYNTSIYTAPYEVWALQKLLRYRQPEVEGFATTD